MVKWIKLENFKCPSCPSKGGNNWVCAVDNDPVWLNEKGIMECTDGSHSGKVITWRWNCGSSYHNGEFLKADLEGFTFALSQAVQLMSKAGSDWVASLITELGKQYGKWYSSHNQQLSHLVDKITRQLEVYRKKQAQI